MQEVCLIRFHPATEEEEVTYISLYSYFNSRGRFGVVANNARHIKDLYLIPLAANDPIPSKLLPFEGPGKSRLFRNMISKTPGEQQLADNLLAHIITLRAHNLVYTCSQTITPLFETSLSCFPCC